MLKELLSKEKEALLHFFETIDLVQLDYFLDQMYKCKGSFILTGIGKSSFIAKKIAATLTSTGSRAFFLSTADALHGDIGVITNQDLFITLSKSGESEELLHLIPYVRNKGAKIATIGTNPTSRLTKASDFSFVLPLTTELCPYNLAPTISTVMQLIVGDLLAIGLMQLKKVSANQFAMNHPSGRIGRRIFTKVKDLMISGADIPLCLPEDILLHTMVTLTEKKCGCVLVVDSEHHLKGIFTDGDLRRSLLKWGTKALETKMEELMTLTPRSIAADELAVEALVQMEADQKKPITVLVVLNELKEVVGLIKMHDIVQSGL